MHSIHGHSLDRIIIHLPPGLGHSSTVTAAAINDEPAQLAHYLEGTVVSINYRLSEATRFPTPIHDVLFGHDWVLKNLVRPVPQDQDEQAPRLGVVGSHVGGSLAAMLALTECKPWMSHVACAALHEPIMDWTSLDSRSDSENRKRAMSQGAIQLLGLRDKIFTKTVDYFDPFASPILFFRTPGVPVPETPVDKTQLDDFVDLAELEKLDFYRQQNQLASLGNALQDKSEQAESPQSNTTPSPSDPPKLRRSSRRYPPNGSGLLLPNFSLSHAQGSVLEPTIDEFAACVRKSMVRDSEDREQAMLDVEEVVRVSCTSGRGIDVVGVASWFREIL